MAGESEVGGREGLDRGGGVEVVGGEEGEELGGAVAYFRTPGWRWGGVRTGEGFSGVDVDHVGEPIDRGGIPGKSG